LTDRQAKTDKQKTEKQRDRQAGRQAGRGRGSGRYTSFITLSEIISYNLK
jgi:hypothetical protein